MADLISRAAAIAKVEKARKAARTLTGMDFVMVLKDQPAVDAVPVEWLQRRRDIYLKAYHAGHESELHTAAILNDTLMAWQKEQEARDSGFCADDEGLAQDVHCNGERTPE